MRKKKEKNYVKFCSNCSVSHCPVLVGLGCLKPGLEPQSNLVRVELCQPCLSKPLVGPTYAWCNRASAGWDWVRPPKLHPYQPLIGKGMNMINYLLIHRVAGQSIKHTRNGYTNIQLNFPLDFVTN